MIITAAPDGGLTVAVQDFDADHLIKVANVTSVVEAKRWVLVGDTVILALTIVGSILILGGMFANEIRKRASTVRMRMVQSLVISDLIMGVVGLVGCGLNLNGKNLVKGSPECDGLGVMMVAVIFSQHLWTLALAVTTFMILTKPLNPFTSIIEKYWGWSWLIVWGICFGIGALGHALYEYGPAGGICHYQNNSGLYAELIQFLPRAVVFIIIALLYGRLYVFLRRPDKIRTGYSNGSVGSGSYSKVKGSIPWTKASRQKRRSQSRERHSTDHHGIRGWFGKQTKTVIVGAHSDTHGSVSLPGMTTSVPDAATPSEHATSPTPGRSLRGRPKLWRPQSKHSIHADAPWERVELPAFQVDGERFGGPSPAPQASLWSDWKGFRGKRQGMQRTDSTPTSPTRSGFDQSKQEEKGPKTLADSKDKEAESNGKEKPVSPETLASVAEGEVSPTPTAVSLAKDRRPSGPDFKLDERRGSVPSLDGRRGSSCVSPLNPTWRGVSSGSVQPSPTTPATATTLVPSAPSSPGDRSSQRRPSLIPSHVLADAGTGVGKGVSRASISSASSVPDRTEKPERPPQLPRATSYTDLDLEKGLMSDDEDWDLMRMLQEPPPKSRVEDPFEVTQPADRVEYVEESMASYLNRKTALLMLWFPLGYVFLFSISTIRLVYDFVGQPPLALRVLSRWSMFGQGLLNSLIYGVVEWHTKRVVRRHVRKGTFSPRGSGVATGSGIRRSRGLGSFRPTSPPAAPTQTGSQIQRSASPQVSFVDPEMSILQRLDLDREQDPKASDGPDRES